MGVVTGLIHAVQSNPDPRFDPLRDRLAQIQTNNAQLQQLQSLADLAKAAHVGPWSQAAGLSSPQPSSSMVNQSAPLQTPTTMPQMPSSQPMSLADMNTSMNQGFSASAPLAAPTQANQSGFVQMQAPDGSINQVPAEHSSYYQSRGARML